MARHASRALRRSARGIRRKPPVLLVAVAAGAVILVGGAAVVAGGGPDFGPATGVESTMHRDGAMMGPEREHDGGAHDPDMSGWPGFGEHDGH